MTEPPSETAQDLAGRVIAVPEARLLDVLASLLERRGAKVMRCPLVGIHDSSDQPSIVSWIRRRISGPSDDLLIFYTGEGVERLLAAASRAGLDGELVAALRRTRKLIRGPKPRRALRKLDLEPELEAREPTTAGLIATLKTIELPKRRVALQLYAPDQEMELVEYLRGRSIEPDCVAPYVYASAAEDERVVELIEALSAGKVDAIAFTSKAQVARLRKLARDRELEAKLERGLALTRVAAIGPVVGAELESAGIRIDTMPEEHYSMKPLVTALCEALGPK